MKNKYLPVVEWKRQVLDYQSCDEIQINNLKKNKECTHTVARNSSGHVELRTFLGNNKTKVLTKIRKMEEQCTRLFCLYFCFSFSTKLISYF